MGETRNAYKILVENLEGKIPLRRPRYRWDLWEIRWKGTDWMDLVQDRIKWRLL
jgi:hypothetical protein